MAWQWRIAQRDSDAVETLVRELLVSPLFADILISRGFRDPALARAHLKTKL